MSESRAKQSLIAIFLYTFAILILPIYVYSEPNCTDVYTLFARGSGQSQEVDDRDLGNNRELKKYRDELEKHIGGSNITFESLAYPAPAVGIFHPINSTGSEFELETEVGDKYQDSVEQGRNSAKARIEYIAAQCEGQTSIILGGYSQGAHVMGDVLFNLSQRAREQIVYVGLFGDPKFKHDSWSTRGNWANSRGGILEARGTDFPDEYRERVESWCLNEDGICEDNYYNAKFGTHGDYPDQAIPTAAQVAYRNYRKAELGLPFEGQPHETPEDVSDVDIQSVLTHQADTVVLADMSSSMHMPWFRSGENLGWLFDHQGSGNRNIGLIAYGDDTFKDITIIHRDLDEGGDYQSDFEKMFGGSRGRHEKYPMHLLTGIREALDTQNWSTEQKEIWVLTDSPFYAEESGTRLELEDIIDELNRKNISVHFIHRGLTDIADLNQKEYLSAQTGGTFQTIEGNNRRFASNVYGVFRSYMSNPVATIGGPITGYVGEKVYFNGGASYDPNNYITSYHWDFDDDGVIDNKSHLPTAAYIYNQPYDGMVRMVVRSADGGSSTVRAKVNITNEPAKEKLYPPRNLKVSKNADSLSYDLSWSHPESGQPAGYLVLANGIPQAVFDGSVNSVNLSLDSVLEKISVASIEKNGKQSVAISNQSQDFDDVDERSVGFDDSVNESFQRDDSNVESNSENTQLVSSGTSTDENQSMQDSDNSPKLSSSSTDSIQQDITQDSKVASASDSAMRNWRPIEIGFTILAISSLAVLAFYRRLLG